MLLTGRGKQFRESYLRWVEDALRVNFRQRENRWTESIAAGSEKFIKEVKAELGYRARGRKIAASASKTGQGFEVREHVDAYRANFDAKNGALSLKNRHFLKLFDINTGG